ncbi:MAG: hypothetical protein LBO71_03090, partial [Prevotellaceae bacterium]|jgi:hypothetical protein|nr:hypothetical protein [Prevotellaceae bacterium]
MLAIRKHRIWGVAIGLAVPVVAFFASYLQYSGAFSLPQYLQFLTSHSVLSKVLSLCVVPNLVAFFVAITFNRDSIAHGVLFSTIALALAVAVVYFTV